MIQDKVVEFFKSRWSGTVLGPIYGLLIYLYLTYLIFNGPPFTPNQNQNQNQTAKFNHNVGDVKLENLSDQKINVESCEIHDIVIEKIKSSPTVESGSFKRLNRYLNQSSEISDQGTESDTCQPLMTVETSHQIGGTIGFSTGVFLSVTSVFSQTLRSTMLLVIPSIITRRGRSFMLTTAFGFLLSGPIESIDTNVQEVVRAITCLYNQVKEIAEDYYCQNQRQLRSFAHTLNEIKNLTQKHKKEVATKLNKAQKTIVEKFDQTKKKVESANSALQTVKRKCKPLYSFITFGLNRKDCFGYDIPDLNPNRVLDKKLGSGNVETSLKGVIRLIDPNDDVENLEIEELTDKVEASSISRIREKLKTILTQLFENLKCTYNTFAKILYLSILFVITDAMAYLRKYYSDDSFDNKFVDNNLKRFWDEKEKPHLTPLRKWELNQNYQYPISVKLSKHEVYIIAYYALPTLLAFTFAYAVIFVDAKFAEILHIFRENAKFGISFDGMEQGFSLKDVIGAAASASRIQNINITAFNLTTDACLPIPTPTSIEKLLPIYFLISLCLFTCGLEAYTSRLRCKICNFFYPERAKERASFLHRSLKTGRMARRNELPIIISRRRNKWNRSREFYPNYYAIRDALLGRFVTKKVDYLKCPACSNAYSEDNVRMDYKIKKYDGEKIYTFICADCNQDV